MTTGELKNPLPSASRELIHEINNFLNLVVTAGQVALDEDLAYTPERALEVILESAGELSTYVRSTRAALLG